MKIFLSSTFADLIPERDALLVALRKKRMSSIAMEDFLATPRIPIETVLENLRNSDLMILVIGSEAGSLLPDGSGNTYTSAEYDELLKLGKEALVFVKEGKRWPWSRRARWRNKEKDSKKRKALENFKSRVGTNTTWDTFTTPDQLVSAALLAIDQWNAKGRPGARKTFASSKEYFSGKNPAGHFQLLDFGTTLLGRDAQIQSFREFVQDHSQRVCILSGRGGIGKSKILHDWAELDVGKTIFLKDEPLWHVDSDKEIPMDATTVIVDDAHRQDGFGKVLQLIQDLPSERKMKLIVSTRPGSTARLAQQIFRKFDPASVTQLPELQELSRHESRALAEQVLGSQFRGHAEHLAQIGSNSPLVIVAGGRLIADRKVVPAALTTLDEFRSAVFNRVLDEMELRGPKFAIDPPMPVLHLIAALGPIEVDRREFQEAASALLGKEVDEILATIDTLASHGIITPRGKPIRILPDVLSDYILEERCIGPGNRSTQYADRVYNRFGAHSLKSLMLNLAELDWRKGQSNESGLNLLDGIWADIHRRFRTGDEYGRHQILSDLSGAALYQPKQVLELVGTAINNPVQVDPTGDGSHYRSGQDYVLSVLPALLEATAHHSDHLTESVTTLWELVKTGEARQQSAESARSVIKRLASWHRFGNVALNFAMLLQAVRLAKRTDAFTGEYTPFAIISRILEREGEYNEWHDDESTISFGGFGLAYAAVGPVRESTLDYLEHVLAGDGRPAILAIGLLEGLFHNFLTRTGRIRTQEEDLWQNKERERCLSALLKRYQEPSSDLLKARIYDAIRSATAISCPIVIQQKAEKVLQEIQPSDPVHLLDALCTADHELPQLTREFDAMEWRKPFEALMAEGWRSLERMTLDAAAQARTVIQLVETCIMEQVKTSGFHSFLLSSGDHLDFLSQMADQMIAHRRLDEMLNQLSSIFHAIHVFDATSFRRRAFAALESGNRSVILAAANNMRVFDDAIEEDVTLIQAYGTYPERETKNGSLHAIAYMGKFTELLESLKRATLSIHANGDAHVAAELANAFGSYGISLTSLTRTEAAAVAAEFLSVHNWDFNQGAIPRFLSSFANLFPDETYELLTHRIQERAKSRQQDGTRRAFGVARRDVSFGGVAPEKRIELGRRCLIEVLRSNDDAYDYAKLFWSVAGYEHAALQLILEVAPTAGQQEIRNIAILIREAPPRLAFLDPAFAKDLVRQFEGEQRRELVNAFGNQVLLHSGGVYSGDLEEHWAEENRQLDQQRATFPDEPGFEDLGRAIRGNGWT